MHGAPSLPSLSALRIGPASRDEDGACGDAEVGAPYASAYSLIMNPSLNKSFSVVDEINKQIHWRNLTLRLQNKKNEEPDASTKARLDLVERAIAEYDTWRKWIVRCSAPPLAFKNDDGQKIADMQRWVAKETESVEAGKLLEKRGGPEETEAAERVRKLYIEQQRIASNLRTELTTEITQSKKDDENFQTVPETFLESRCDRKFWIPLIEGSAFGAAAPRGGHNKRYQKWLEESLTAPPEDAASGRALLRSNATDTPAAAGLQGSIYNGDIPKSGDFTIEHVIPHDWCKLARYFRELVQIGNNVHLIGLATQSDNSSRQAKPLSFVTNKSKRTYRAGEPSSQDEIEYDPLLMAKYLYNPHNFSDARKAATARITICAFLTYPMLSDAPSYAGWPSGRLGSLLYSAQWKHIQQLLKDRGESTEWEQRLNWMQWYRFGWCNPVIHEQNIVFAPDFETLLKNRLSGDDAISALLYETLNGGQSVEDEISNLIDEIRTLKSQTSDPDAQFTEDPMLG